METNDIVSFIDKCHIFDGKNLSRKQIEIAIKFCFGSSVKELACYYNMTEIGIRKHLDSTKIALGSTNLSELRVIVFMNIIMTIFNK